MRSPGRGAIADVMAALNLCTTYCSLACYYYQMPVEQRALCRRLYANLITFSTIKESLEERALGCC